MIQFLYNLYFRYWKRWGWFGDFPNWQAAQATCGGYDSNEIIEKVRASALKVKNGEAAFERDSVLFFEEENDKNLLKCLENVANSLQKAESIDNTTVTVSGALSLRGTKQPEGSLRIIDFGGSLGSTYFQHQKALKKYPNLIWCVVEQPHFVEIGKREFETENLYFEYTLQAAFERFKPHFFLLNSVLQYIEKPYHLLKEVENLKIPYILIQRTPMIDDTQDRITQQIAHPSVYKASYASWVFGEKYFKSKLANSWTIDWEQREKYGLHHVASKPLFLKDLFLSNKSHNS